MTKHAYNFRDLSGLTYGKLTVKKLNEIQGKISYYLCECECGNTVVVARGNLTTGNTSSCGCLKKEVNRKSIQKLIPQKGVDAAVKKLYRDYLYSARQKRRAFDLSLEEFKILTSQACFYCNTPPSYKQRTYYDDEVYVYNGIDRVDNYVGYTLDNCVPCCRFCNVAKRSYTLEEFIAWAKRLSDFQTQKGWQNEHHSDNLQNKKSTSSS